MWGYRTFTILAVVLVGVTTLACVESDEDEEPSHQTGINTLTEISASDKNDVAWMKYSVTKCGEQEVIYESKKRLKDLTLPGGISTFVDNPLSRDSYHSFADYLLLVETGCYDVHVQPLDEDKENSKKCRSVTKQDIQVSKGKTTEVLLVSQCKGKKTGLFDVITGLNHAPKIVDLEYKSTHFLKCKKGPRQVEVEICARAIDKDGDPMNFYWNQKSGPPIDEGQPVVDSFEQYNKVATECVTYTLPKLEEGQANYVLKLSVYDKFIDEDGNKIHAEDWINDAFYDGEKVVKSRHVAKFPLRLICKDSETIEFENSASVSSDEVDVNLETNTDTATVKVKGYAPYCEDADGICEYGGDCCESDGDCDEHSAMCCDSTKGSYDFT